MQRLNADIPKNINEASSKPGLSFKVNLFSFLKKSIWAVLFIRGWRQGVKQSRSHGIFTFWYGG